MYEETPNKEEIDWIEKRLLDIFNYEQLKDCDIDYLYNLEFAVENRLMIFEITFPSEKGVRGAARAFAFDYENEDKEALTDAEMLRLQLLRMETRREIHRAFGHRLELRRDHRGTLANSIADMVTAITKAIPTP